MEDINREARSPLFTPVELLLLLLIIGVSAFLRLYRLDSVLPGFPGDEAWTGLEARRILEEGPIGPWSPSGLGQPAGPLYWTAFLFLFFPDTLFTTRVSTATLGILAIPAFYLLVRVSIDRRIALPATALLGVSYWHIAYSRMAFNVVSLTLIECLTLFMLFLGLKRNSILLIALAGAIFGLGIYTYSGFHFFAVAVLAFWLFRLWRGWRSPKTILYQAFSFFLLAGIVAVPYLSFLAQEPDKVFSYNTYVSAFKTEEYRQAQDPLEKARYLVNKGVRSASIYFVGRDVDYTDGLGKEALLDPAMGVLLVVGLAISVLRWKDERHFLILMALAVAAAALALLTPGAWGENRRGISALPFVFLAGAFALDSIRVVWQRWLKGRALYISLAVLIGFSAYWNVHYYFSTLNRDPITKWIYVYDLVQAIDHLKENASEGSYVYFYAGRWSYNYETRRFLLPDIPGEDRSREFGGTVSIYKSPSHGEVVYLLLPPYLDLIDQIRGEYPNGEYYQVEEGGVVLFRAYYVGPR